jgi:hypothetical protein
MKRNDNVHHFTDKSRELLEEIMKREHTDEMGLLDLIFIEEILDRKGQDSAA